MKYERASSEVVSQYLFQRCVAMVCFAEAEVPFYRNFYRSKGFSSEQIKEWDDWQRVPIVTKADMQNFSLGERCAAKNKGMKINTGGTSGQPLEFYLDSRAFGREWAHMHAIWKAHGYRPHHLKLTFRGKHFEQDHPIRYNAVHNEYVVNANCHMRDIVEALMELPRKDIIRWIHGYPSLIAEFSHELSCSRSYDVNAFSRRLFGVLLGSEYPAPVYRDAIAENLSTNIVSWYGHSEMALLARETALGVYQSFPTYGYAEAVPAQGSEHRLICTSHHNFTHPFIRYDTGDLVEPVCFSEPSLAFRITEGRVGDFIIDRQGKRHSLTAIIFGRHHSAFSLLKHLQVREDSRGEISLVATPQDMAISTQRLMAGFDLDDLDINWNLEVVESPIRTQAGKIRLKIT
ncbi:CoF synthetase [Halomonas sp. JS92-SW72]|uniref:CoF synthetase n=1 Tax=Halomonas sp. JS92-SW72 TaxID=2306583 RepID=UPI0013C2D575|nr:CoF synthetase [Halomonas sp. JS92-SW72]